METKTDLKAELDQFNGTGNYYPSSFGTLKLTDGIKFLCEKAKCYWLIDIIESYQPKIKKIATGNFQLWILQVNKCDDTAVVTCREDTTTPIIISQKIPFTDFPLEEIKLYCINGVVLLPSEY